MTYAYVVVAREHGVEPAYLLDLIRSEQAKGYTAADAYRRALQTLWARYDDISDGEDAFGPSV
jgi:hypothetical protein